MKKGTINKVICTAAGIGILVFGSMLDSRTYWQYVAFGICTIIFFAYGVANGWMD